MALQSTSMEVQQPVLVDILDSIVEADANLPCRYQGVSLDRGIDQAPAGAIH